jgi:NAD:arginine ADP-ribosyltransferase
MSIHQQRYLNAVHEVYTTLSPLGRFFKGLKIPPDFDFDQAMNPIIEAINLGDLDMSLDELEPCIALTKIKMDEIYDSGQISVVDIPFSAGCAVLMYTAEAEFFKKLNEYLREASRQYLRYFAMYIWLLEYGLLCAPKYLGTSVFRGIKGTELSENDIKFSVS